MVDTRRIFGTRGEDLAASYLKDRGYRILAKQFRGSAGEVDLVAQQGSEFVFVEVKSRQSLAYGYPEEAVTPAKLRKIARVAEEYLFTSALLDAPWRVDVIAILAAPGNEPEIAHFTHVGLPG